MSRLLARLAAVALLLGLASPAQTQEERQQERVVTNTWYAQALARADVGLNVTNFWAKGPKMRAETVVQGHRIVTIVNGEWYYAYDSLGMTGVAIKRSAEAQAVDQPDRRPFGQELAMLEGQGAELVGKEEMMGRACDVYRVTDSRGRRQVWVTSDEVQLPLRVEIFTRKSGTRQYTDFLKWLNGMPVPDAFFVPEAQIQIQRYELVEYQRLSAEKGPLGPVPILYADLLHGPRASK
jgi:hypothetical protein